MKRGDSLLGLFVFLLIGAFALLSLTAVLAGGKVYANIADRAEANTDIRTTAAYITGKVRAFDRKGAVAVTEENGMSVLRLTDELEGQRYVTYIYAQDGAVREYYQRAERDFLPDHGEKIAEAESLAFVLSDDGLQITVKQQDAESTVFVALRAGGVQ